MTDNYIVFTLAGTAYALPSESVSHVEMIEQITPVPNAPPAIEGVVFSRGEVVPAVNLRVRFGFERIPLDLRTRLLVVRRDDRSTGLLVDEAREFLVIPPAAIHPPGDGLAALSGRYLGGIATLGDRMILILELSEVLNTSAAVLAGDGGLAQQGRQETDHG